LRLKTCALKAETVGDGRNRRMVAMIADDRDAAAARPDRIQRLLNRAAWDMFTAMGEMRRFAAAGWRRRRGGRTAR
jgi:hypothetical protein